MRPSLVRFLSPKLMEKMLVKVQDAPRYLAPIQESSRALVVQKFTDLNNWYTRLLGLDEVKQYQDRVVSLQERLLQAQEMRRSIGDNLAQIRKTSNQLQDEIHKVKRQEDIQRFLDLMREETEVLRQEADVSRAFQQCDQAERELFQAFTNAVRDSHEKQRAQLEYTKYFGIILSIAGSFLAFVYTSWRKNDLKQFIEQRMQIDEIKLQPVAVDNAKVGEVIRNENMKLRENINSSINVSWSEVVRVVEQEREERKRILVVMGVGVTLLFVFNLLMSGR